MSSTQIKNEIIWNIDNDPDILNYRFPDGTSIWLAVRMDFNQVIGNSDVAGPANEPISKAWKRKIKFYRYVLFSLCKSPFRVKSRLDVLSIANWEGDYSCPNRMTQFLKDVPELKSQQLLYSLRYECFWNLRNNYSFDYFMFRNLIRTKLAKKVTNPDIINTVNLFIAHISKYADDYINSEALVRFRENTINIAKRILGFRMLLKKFLLKAQPKLIVLSEGNNGDWMRGTLFHLTKEMDIKTAEIQHGIFGIGMKYGEDLSITQEFKNHKTNYILLYGDYHRNAVNAGGEPIIYGNYFLEKKRNQVGKVRKSFFQKRILFVCEGIPYTSKDNEFVTQVCAGLSGYRESFELIIRLHQTEEPGGRYQCLESFPNSRYSRYDTENIFDLLKSSDIVIGHTSTVLFEALYFGVTPLVFDDDFSRFIVPENFGIKFNTAEELIKILNIDYPWQEVSDEDRKNYWAPGSCISNFKQFWNQHLKEPVL